MVEELQEQPYSVRVLAAARQQINAMFERYKREHIDTWEPRPCPPADVSRGAGFTVTSGDASTTT